MTNVLTVGHFMKGNQEMAQHFCNNTVVKMGMFQLDNVSQPKLDVSKSPKRAHNSEIGLLIVASNEAFLCI